jgi:type II secretory pathway component PulK
MMSPGPRQSRGAALIIALMVLALVGVIGASMSLDYLITVKRASNQLIGEQAYSYGIAAEAFAIKALQMDLLLDTQEKGGRHDALDEFWAQESPPFQTAEGAYGGRLYDLSGRFNINTLANQAERQGEARNRHDVLTVHEGRFYRLLRSLSNEDEDFLVTEEQALPMTSPPASTVRKTSSTPISKGVRRTGRPTGPWCRPANCCWWRI